MDFEFNIRKATANDMIYVYEMIKELADFEKVPNGPKIDYKNGFETENPGFRCFVAETLDSKSIVGHAIYYPTYSTWDGRSLFLEDLYVKSEYRRRHIGLNLMKAIAKEAVNEKFCRLDFHVISWNHPAMAFYEKLNAVDLTKSEDLDYVRLGKEALIKLTE